MRQEGVTAWCIAGPNSKGPDDSTTTVDDKFVDAHLLYCPHQDLAAVFLLTTRIRTVRVYRGAEALYR